MKKLVIALNAFVIIVISTFSSLAGTWEQDSGGWKWNNGDKTYPKNCWQWCDGNNDGTAECYYFDKNGYCLVNTTTPAGYQVNTDGAWIVNGVVQTKAITNNNQTGWVKDSCGWKYLENGETLTEKIITDPDGSSYIVGEDGYMVYDGWYGVYYVDGNGRVLKNTITPDGYYVDSNGKYVANSTYNNQYSSTLNRCIKCNGKGIATCGVCQGQPLQFCMVCNGTGHATLSGMKCYVCNGTGYSKCNYCYGKGYVTCSWCRGFGYR